MWETYTSELLHPWSFLKPTKANCLGRPSSAADGRSVPSGPTGGLLAKAFASSTTSIR